MDRSQFEEQIVRTISKAENTFEQKNQSNQSDAINDTARAIRSKRYGQRYDQDKPRGGYIASSTYAKTKDLSEKLDIQEVNVGR